MKDYLNNILNWIKKLINFAMEIQTFKKFKNWMSTFSVSRELDSTELVKWISAIIGAVIVFVFIELKKLDLQEAEAQAKVATNIKGAMEDILKYRPRLKINYTNMLTSDGKKLEIRVNLTSVSAQELYVFPPKLELYGTDGLIIDKNLYKVENIGSFQGSISPNITFKITYIVDVSEITKNNLSEILLDYEVQANDMDTLPMKYYVKQYEDPYISKLLNNITAKKFIYKENIYQFDKNPIWNDFWENPR